LATLFVRNVPDGLHARLKARAVARQRSLSAEVISLLEQAISNDERQQQQQAKLLATIRRRRFVPPHDAPDGVTLIREDRQR
jgi:plasmid stability protein